MTELLFVLTLIFVGYVVREVFKTVSETNSERIAGTDPIPAPTENILKVPADVAEVETPAAAVSEPVAESTPAPAETPASPGIAAPPERGVNLRNPATGETALAPTNYRFAKKWIKEALVAEGLLDHVYKPSELDEAGSRTVKEALEIFRFLDKYQA